MNNGLDGEPMAVAHTRAVQSGKGTTVSVFVLVCSIREFVEPSGCFKCSLSMACMITVQVSHSSLSFLAV